MAEHSVNVGEAHGDTTNADEDPRIVAAVKEYLAELENGVTSRSEFLARHAEIADELVGYLDGLELVVGAANEAQRTIEQLVKSNVQPTSLGDFRILREIGRGGMGVVYEALHLPLCATCRVENPADC